MKKVRSRKPICLPLSGQLDKLLTIRADFVAVTLFPSFCFLYIILFACKIICRKCIYAGGKVGFSLN